MEESTWYAPKDSAPQEQSDWDSRLWACLKPSCLKLDTTALKQSAFTCSLADEPEASTSSSLVALEHHLTIRLNLTI